MAFYATMHQQVKFFGWSVVNSPTEEVDLPCLLFKFYIPMGVSTHQVIMSLIQCPCLEGSTSHDESRWLSIHSFTEYSVVPAHVLICRFAALSLVTRITKVHVLGLSDSVLSALDVSLIGGG